MVKNPPAMQETLVRSLGWDDPLEKGKATHSSILGLPLSQLVKNPPAMQETWVQSLGWEHPLEKGTATYSSILGVARWATVHGIPKSLTGLNHFSLS